MTSTFNQFRPRSALAWLCAVVVCSCVWLILPQPLARAETQEENSTATGAEEPSAPGTAAVPASAAEEQPAPKRQNYLSFFFNALGWRYTIAFLIISFTFVAFLVMNIIGLRRDAVNPQYLVEEFEAQVNEKKFQEAFDLAKNDESMLGQMLAAGMQNLQLSYDKAMEAMGQVAEDENLKLEHRLSF